jgi:hypothetical protein
VEGAYGVAACPAAIMARDPFLHKRNMNGLASVEEVFVLGSERALEHLNLTQAAVTAVGAAGLLSAGGGGIAVGGHGNAA